METADLSFQKPPRIVTLWSRSPHIPGRKNWHIEISSSLLSGMVRGRVRVRVRVWMMVRVRVKL